MSLNPGLPSRKLSVKEISNEMLREVEGLTVEEFISIIHE